MVSYQGHWYGILGKRGGSLLTPKDLGMTPTIFSTACRRGYICRYSFQNDTLFLSEMLIRTRDGTYTQVDGVSPQMNKVFEAAEYFELRVPCPFTGGLILVRDHVQGFSSIPVAFETVLEMVFDTGHITEIKNHSNKALDVRRQINDMSKTGVSAKLSHADWQKVVSLEALVGADYERQPPMFLRDRWWERNNELQG
jgi:hypothetical protein